MALRQVVKKVHVEGALAYFVEHTQGNLALLKAVGGGKDTEVLSVSPHDGADPSVGPRLGIPVDPNSLCTGACPRVTHFL